MPHFLSRFLFVLMMCTAFLPFAQLSDEPLSPSNFQIKDTYNLVQVSIGELVHETLTNVLYQFII